MYIYTVLSYLLKEYNTNYILIEEHNDLFQTWHFLALQIFWSGSWLAK